MKEKDPKNPHVINQQGCPKQLSEQHRSKLQERKIQQALLEVNWLVALFRDNLVKIGTNKDGPELREQIRKVRIAVVDEVNKTTSFILPHVKKCMSEGMIIDNSQLVCLYLLTRLLARELEKCLHLVKALPMQDMDKYFGLYAFHY